MDGADGSRGDGADDDNREEERQDDSGSDNDDIPDFDLGDWVMDPRKETPSGNNGGAQPEAHHGDGAGDAVNGDEATTRDDGPSLTMEESSLVLAENERLKSLESMRRTAEGIHDAVGVGLHNTLRKVIHDQQKRLTKRNKNRKPGVLQQMHESADVEEALNQQQRLEYKESLRQKRESTEISKMLNDGKVKLAKLRKDEASVEAAKKINEQMKRYSLDAMGAGNKSGGTAAHKKVRRDVLMRLRGCGGLSAEQDANFLWFIDEWDRVNADAKAGGWAKIFAEEMQNLTNKLIDGDTVAVSHFMYEEMKRCLSHVPCLMVPGKLIYS